MKTNAEIVVELQKANKANTEFSQEIAKLSAELEQEKTKVSLLQNEHRKSQVCFNFSNIKTVYLHYFLGNKYIQILKIKPYLKLVDQLFDMIFHTL